MPVPDTLGVLWPCQASAHDCHSLSRHIGSSIEAPPYSSGEFGKHTHPLVPALSWRGLSPSLAGQSMIVACLAISAGAAAMALATFSTSVSFLAFAGVEWECCALRTGTTRSTRRTRRWTLTRFIENLLIGSQVQ